MATLELTIDATGMERGAQQAQQAIDKVTKAAQQSQQTLNKAFQTSGGAIQVAGGIAQTAKAFADLNVSAAAFGASRTLLEIGRTVQDFRELNVAAGRTGTIFTTLRAIMTAHPLMTIVTVLSAVGGAMALFADNTQKAADAYQNLGTSLRKAQLDAQTSAYLGLPYTPDLAQQRRDVFQMVQQAQTTGQGINLRTMGEFGYGDLVANYLAEFGGQGQRGQAQQYIQYGGVQRTGMRPVPGLQGMMPYTFTEPGLPDLQLTSRQTQEVLRILDARLRQQVDTRGIVDMPGGYYPSGAIGPEPDYQLAERMAAADQKALAIEERKLDLIRKQEESVQRAADYAANIGATVGSAFADVLMKTTTLRQAFASIVASIARQGLSDVGAAIFRGAVSGLTPTQAGGNAGLTAPGTTPRN